MQDLGVVECVDHSLAYQRLTLEVSRVIDCVPRAGFLEHSRLRRVRLDRPMLTAFIERWRPETSTFHLRVGEMTITLHDVAVLFGLYIYGPVVTRTYDRDWIFECERLLGRLPPQLAIRGGAVKLQWFRDQFTLVPPYLEDMEEEQYTRAYMLHMFGTRLFPDSTTNNVHLRWLPLLEDLDVCGALS